MRKQLGLRHYFAIGSLVTVLVVSFSFLNERVPSSRDFLSKNWVSNNVFSTNYQRQRKGLLIIGQGRSGTSFLSRMFASGERIFEVYEPLRHRKLTNVEKIEVLKAFLSCNFASSPLWRKDYFPPFWYLKQKYYFVTPSQDLACLKYRGGTTRCFRAEQLFIKFLDKCRYSYESTVVKELTDRLPNTSLSSLIPEIIDRTIGTDIRLLHVVRDPRGSINSRIKLKWMPDYEHPQFQKKVQTYCDEIIQNIEFGLQLNESLQQRYKLIFYKDLATRPVESAREVFKFAGLKLSEKTLNWIENRTSPSKMDSRKQFKNPYSLVRDSKSNIEKWRMESPPERTLIIERICKPLIKLIEKISIEREYF